jgi:hypothetical protein|tara:strand:+ start:940 stop:1131 length:192 start_codon:yes stop_codon:yes gene_type:complete
MKEELKLLVERLNILQDIRVSNRIRNSRTRSALARESIDEEYQKNNKDIYDTQDRINKLIDKL